MGRSVFLKMEFAKGTCKRGRDVVILVKPLLTFSQEHRTVMKEPRPCSGVREMGKIGRVLQDALQE